MKEEIFRLPNGSRMAFVWIKPGEFKMGSPESEGGRFLNEGPIHEVKISNGFWLGKFPVMQGQWTSEMDECPWSGKNYVITNPSHPAVYISWDDVNAFVNHLNDKADEKLYRLPTEAEWEYACRAGTSTRWSFGDDEELLDEYAWYGTNAADLGHCHGHAVGRKCQNDWGLYDMHGNVYEWVQDWYGKDYYESSPRVDPSGPSTGSDRVNRGGCFHSSASDKTRDLIKPNTAAQDLPSENSHSAGYHLRSAYRNYNLPNEKSRGIGARLVRIS